MFNKRGISPLIATVLIIGFTIALAALIITWGVSFVTQQTVETGEEAQETLDLVKNSGIKIRKVTFNDADPDTFDVQIENTGTITLDGFLIRAYDTNGDVYTNDYLIPNGLGA
ncbi:MAG: archaellin/type IV pilin N-terminal domain-containing protein, partial [Nanoarchaeota archaeon]